MTLPLKLKVFKLKGRLKEGDKYKTKPELAVEIIEELKESGFKIKRVVSNSLYGESHRTFVSSLEKLKIEYAVGIRSIVDLIESKTLTGAKRLFGKGLGRLNLTLIDYTDANLIAVVIQRATCVL
ncbi:hypothetical protein KQ311_03910 [Synechocystis sp. CS-94]|nr:Mobile element protein [Synechocystis sp. PCC 6714]MCT0252995.1 hypothetical protein [Synechocystis sp. CS-94]